MKRIVMMLAIAGLGFWAASRFFGSGLGMVRPPAPPSDAESQVVEHFTLEGFQSNGDRLWELVGDFAHVAKSLDVFIEKNVVLKVRGTTTIRGDKVFWRRGRSILVTNQPVQINQGGHVITGVGALCRADDEFLQIDRKVHMMLEGPVDLTCRGPFQIYRKQNRAVFRRGVVIVDAKGTVTADRMDVHFSEADGKIHDIVARGHVRIERGENISLSDEAIYNAQTQSVKLVGAPRLLLKEKDLVASQVK